MSQSSLITSRVNELPRIRNLPLVERLGTYGPEVVELARSVGMTPDYWQSEYMNDCLSYTHGGRYCAFEAGLAVPRQNGKGDVIIMRKIGGAFVLNEQMICYSAHQFNTATEHFARTINIIEGSADLSRFVRRISKGNGKEEIILYGPYPHNRLTEPRRIKYVARTGNAGRGFTGDVNIWDEAQALSNAELAAQLPALSARSVAGNPQILMAGTPPDPDSSATKMVGEVWLPFRKRGIAGEQRLLWWEYSPPDKFNPADQGVWKMTNPALDTRISREFVQMEFNAMGNGGPQFLRERLGKFPDDAAQQWRIIRQDDWMAAKHPEARSTSRPVYAIDINPERTRSTIVSAAYVDGHPGKKVLDVIAHMQGTSGVVGRVVSLQKHEPFAILVDARSPASSLIEDFRDAGIEVETTGAPEMAQGCAMLYDGVSHKDLDARDVWHLGQQELDSAIAGMDRRKIGDGQWGLDRVAPSVVITPAVGAALALLGLKRFGRESGVPWVEYG